jgi:sRNA-binding carbon storage regulator CsrA
MINLKQRADESIVVILGDQKVVIRLKDIDHDQAKLDIQANEKVHITHNFSQVEYTD